MYYYGARTDKNGHRLLTSYGNAKMRDKYCIGDGLKKHEGLFVRDLESNQIGPVEEGFVFNPETHDLIRSRITNKNPSKASGKFFIMYKKDDVWHPTQFRGEHYGNMNTLMKALADTYEDLIIVEQAEEATVSSDDSGGYDF